MQTQPPVLRNNQNVQNLRAGENGKRSPGIGGFLVVVAIGLIVSLMQNLGYFLQSLTPFRQYEIWQRLTTPGSDAYHPYWKLVLLFDLISGLAIFGFNVLLVLLFFRKHRAFPKVVVVGLPVTFILFLVGYYLAGLIPAVAENPDYAKQTEQVIIRFITLHIWIPYFLVSERVKKTFVR